jgi:hypothetical protein
MATPFLAFQFKPATPSSTLLIFSLALSTFSAIGSAYKALFLSCSALLTLIMAA